MKKQVIRYLAAILTIILILCSLSACEEVSSGDESNAGFKVAYFKAFNSIAPGLEENIERMVELAGGEIVYVQMRVTPDGIIGVVEEMIALNANGIIVMPTSDSVMVSVGQHCKEAGVYFASLFRSISDPEVLSILESNPYWCGWVADDEASAYEIGRSLGEYGVK